MTNDTDSTFQDLASACQEIERLKSENARLAAGLEHIAEYWNGSQSESAMYETCEHIRNFASSQSGSAAALHDLLAPTIELLRQATLRPVTWQDDVKDELARLRAACGEKGKK